MKMGIPYPVVASTDSRSEIKKNIYIYYWDMLDLFGKVYADHLLAIILQSRT